MHSLFETHYAGGDWRERHAELTVAFGQLFDEERERLGNLPDECARLMRSYLWHYRDEVWKVHEIETVLEAELPDGSLYRGKIDLLIENEFGLWIVDHKTHARLPNLDFRILDAQSALYLWAALRMGIPVQGFIWNYVRTKPPSIPALLKSGDRLSKAKCETDYLTYARAIKNYELDPAPYAARLRYLKSQRYRPGAPQTSPFFRRDILEKSPALLKRVASEAYRTHQHMHSYRWDKTNSIERVPDRSCSFSCSYTDLCTLELFGGNTTNLRRQRYTVGDPNDYYMDDKTPEKGEDPY